MVGTLKLAIVNPCRQFSYLSGGIAYDGYELDGETIYNLGGAVRPCDDGTSWLTLNWVTITDDIPTVQSVTYHFASDEEQSKVLDFYAHYNDKLVSAIIHGLDTNAFVTLAVL